MGMRGIGIRDVLLMSGMFVSGRLDGEGRDVRMLVRGLRLDLYVVSGQR